jgi:hypothetical protein
MLLELKRDSFGAECTLGTLKCGDKLFHVLEDKVREVDGYAPEFWKIAHETAIPKGRYQVVITHSNRFKKPLPLLKDVPGFSGIRIHSGNTALDTEGCLLIGKQRANNAVLRSREAMAEFMPILEHALTQGDVWINVA